MVIIVTVLGGTYLISMIPESIQETFDFVLPAIFGAVLGQFAFTTPKYGVAAILVGLGVFFSPIPSLLKIASCVAITITVIVNMEKRKDKKNA